MLIVPHKLCRMFPQGIFEILGIYDIRCGGVPYFNIIIIILILIIITSSSSSIMIIIMTMTRMGGIVV